MCIVYSKVPLPSIHKCEPAGVECRQVKVEVEKDCRKEEEEEKNCIKEIEVEKEICQREPSKVCETKKVRVAVIKPLGPTVPVSPFTTSPPSTRAPGEQGSNPDSDTEKDGLNINSSLDFSKSFSSV